uniref:Secreted protein n=1 Tax=Thraustotheca clavata TaxID=74557 RepID=A0A0A7CML1_9STRA|nr:secreted protein [Thraustotheca clavata]
MWAYLLIILVVVIWLYQRQLAAPIRPRFGDKHIILMAHETSSHGVFTFTPVATATVYPTINIAALKQRVMDIVNANPWLVGHLATGYYGTVELQYSTTPKNAAQAFKHIKAPFEANLSWTDQCRYLSYLTDVSSGQNCLDKDIQHFFQVLCVDLPDGNVALIMALSHTIGDGYTYYALYKMLDCNQPIVALNPTRAFYDSQPAFDQCSPFSRKAFNSPFVLLRIACLGLPYLWHKFTNPDWQIARSVYRIQLDKVQDIKANYQPTKKAPFLSTNDILASSFFNATNADIGMFAVNIRSRLGLGKGYSAGNYICPFAYTSKDFATGANIRESIQDKDGPHRKVVLDDPIPSWSRAFSGGRTSLLTNWASFYHDLRLENDVVPLLHTPLSQESFIPSDADAVIYYHSANEMRLRARGHVNLPRDVFELLSEGQA